MEDVNGKGVEELVGDDKRRLSRTTRNKANVLTPDYFQIRRVSTYAFVAHVVLMQFIIAAEKLMLCLSETRTGFNQVYSLNGFRQSRKVAYCLITPPSALAVHGDHGMKIRVYPQHIVHQRAPARAHFHETHALALPALGNPFRHNPYSDQLAEDLADFGRSDKISLGSELVVVGGRRRGVVAAKVRGEALAHEGRDRDGASGLRIVSILATALEREDEL